MASQYQTMTNNSEFNIREYLVPTLHVDPRQQILDRRYDDYKNKPKQKKFKANCKHKPCFMDEQIKPFVANPSPDKYKTKDEFEPRQKRHKSADLKKVDKKICKQTYIDEIDDFAKKHKPPGVGKYDLLK